MVFCGYEDFFFGFWVILFIMVKGMYNVGVEMRGIVSLIRLVLVIVGFKIV